ncbi:MAG: carbon-nitrogen family hydrolase [Bacillota bacterium]
MEGEVEVVTVGGGTVKVVLVQMDLAHRDVPANRQRAAALLDSAARFQPDVVVLPETWTSGYSEPVFEAIERYAEPMDGASVNMLREKAAQHGFNLIGGSLAERDGDKFFNTVPVIDRNGRLLGKYRKMHLYSAMGEDRAFCHGAEMPVWDLDFGRAAVMTCYDIRFPELARTYALRGAKLIFVVSNFPKPKLHHWRMLLQARAIENQLFVIACNRVGSAHTSSYFGHSIVIDPWGEIVAEGDEEERIIPVEIQLKTVDEVRARIPVYYDRRPGSYPEDLMKPGLPADYFSGSRGGT